VTTIRFREGQEAYRQGLDVVSANGKTYYWMIDEADATPCTYGPEDISRFAA
jgi:hypothetical protein